MGKKMTFYGQWNPPVDLVLYENYFTDVRNGFFIEAGACDGVSLSCCKMFEDELGWTGINIEPSKNYFNKLVKSRPKSINLNIGIGDKDGILQFNDVLAKTGFGGAGNGSFEFCDEHVKELESYGVSFYHYDSQIKSYKSIISELNIEKVDLFCIDVEGFEFKVIDGMRGCSILPSVLCIEYSYLRLKNVVDYVENIGYKFDMISFNNAYFHRDDLQINIRKFGATKHECCVKDGKITWIEL